MSKVLLITGASSDIGIELLKNVQKNYDYIIAHHNGDEGKLLEWKEKLKDKLILIEGDFLNEDATYQFVDTIIEKKIIPNHIVHLPAKTDWKKFERDINISVWSLIIILNKLLPIMIKENTNNKIVLMLSSCTLNIPPKYISSYVTSKYALMGLMKALAQEYAGKGVTINGISPTMIETKFLNDIPDLLVQQNAMNSPTKENLKVQDVVPTISFLLSNNANSITGQNIAITNGNIM